MTGRLKLGFLPSARDRKIIPFEAAQSYEREIIPLLSTATRSFCFPTKFRGYALKARESFPFEPADLFPFTISARSSRFAVEKFPSSLEKFIHYDTVYQFSKSSHSIRLGSSIFGNSSRVSSASTIPERNETLIPLSFAEFNERTRKKIR